MQHALTLLQELDHLYRSDAFTEYETLWQEVTHQVQQAFPGFTLAYAEIR